MQTYSNDASSGYFSTNFLIIFIKPFFLNTTKGDLISIYKLLFILKHSQENSQKQRKQFINLTKSHNKKMSLRNILNWSRKVSQVVAKTVCLNIVVITIRRNSFGRFLLNLPVSGYKYLPKETKTGKESLSA